MIQSSRRLLRVLGLAHVAVAIVLLPSAMFFGHFSIAVVTPGLIWLVILGFRLWRPNARLRMLLRYTHFVLAPFAILLLAYGRFTLLAAKRSAETGGGLLGAFGLIPIVMGLLAVSLSAVSLCVSYSKAFKNTTEVEQSLGSDSVQDARGLTGAPKD